MEETIEKNFEIIKDRILMGGGLAQKNNGDARPDATAWAILAFSLEQTYGPTIKKACLSMTANQRSDGRVVLTEGLDFAWWPTPLAILAWKKANGFETQTSAAVNLLINSSGLHFQKKKNAPFGHDTTIQGWSWIENTHSWIEPTSLAILALRAAGYARRCRVEEALKMIMDRQLPSGGWNYGNTVVFDKELLPMPDHTGQALCALSGMVPRSEVQKSIDLINGQISSLTSPLSLCWSIFGLRAWGYEISDIRRRILHTLSLQEKYGPYDTTLIAMLIIAYSTEGDLLGFLGIP